MGALARPGVTITRSGGTIEAREGAFPCTSGTIVQRRRAIVSRGAALPRTCIAILPRVHSIECGVLPRETRWRRSRAVAAGSEVTFGPRGRGIALAGGCVAIVSGLIPCVPHPVALIARVVALEPDPVALIAREIALIARLVALNAVLVALVPHVVAQIARVVATITGMIAAVRNRGRVSADLVRTAGHSTRSISRCPI